MYTQNLVPVYVNNGGSRFPRYLKPGKVSFTLNMVNYSELPFALYPGGGVMPTKMVIIGTRAFVVSGTTAESGYTFGGQNSVGEYNHVFESSALNVSSGQIIVPS